MYIKGMSAINRRSGQISTEMQHKCTLYIGRELRHGQYLKYTLKYNL